MTKPPVYDESRYPSGGPEVPRWLRVALWVAVSGLLLWGAFAWFDAHAVRGMTP